MKIIVFGGDGFIGWPLSLRLAIEGFEVVVADSSVRRNASGFMSGLSLSEIPSLSERIKSFNDRKFSFAKVDATDVAQVKSLMASVSPDVVVHLAQQRSAPYSMLTSDHRLKTMAHNTTTTQNILESMLIQKNPVSLVHIGSMGVYGYNKLDQIHEGDLTKKPGSIYHLTKVIDQEIFNFYSSNWGLKITELHQGIVWGTQTELTLSKPAFVNRIDYDGEFGTVLNRFIIQALANYPLTIYGSGNQKRAFIHLEDAVECLVWSIRTSHEVPNGNVRVKNQFTEIFQLKAIAEVISKATNVKVTHHENPRIEFELNQLNSVSSIPYIQAGKHRKIDIDSILKEIEIFRPLIKNVDLEKMLSLANWKRV